MKKYPSKGFGQDKELQLLIESFFPVKASVNYARQDLSNVTTFSQNQSHDTALIKSGKFHNVETERFFLE